MVFLFFYLDNPDILTFAGPYLADFDDEDIENLIPFVPPHSVNNGYDFSTDFVPTFKIHYELFPSEVFKVQVDINMLIL